MDDKFKRQLNEFASLVFRCISVSNGGTFVFGSIGSRYTLCEELQNRTLELLELCKDYQTNRQEITDLGKSIEIYINSISGGLDADLTHTVREKLHQVLAAVERK